jgi:cellulose synthase (UDP-forming)
MDIEYPDFKVYVLNDGKGRNLPGWREINSMAEKYGAIPITRENNKGNKAGNINNALALTYAPFVVVFDADHIPSPDFLEKTMGHFSDHEVVLVQTPQYYKNRNDNFLTTAAWEQQELFFGPICRGKGRMNATFWCGTNAVVRRKALEEIGGVPEDNIAEDFLASFRFHEKGYKTVYVAEVLAEGLAPHNLENYVKQQFRWARGSSEIILRHFPLFNRKLTVWQKIQYMYSSSYYMNGFIALMDALVPIIVLFTGVIPVHDTTSSFMLYFFPFIFSTIYILMLSTENTITFRAIQLSMSSSFVFMQAVMDTIRGTKSSFKVTSKAYEAGNFLKYALPHFAYMAAGITAIIYGLAKYGFVPSLITNASWILFNMAMFSGFIRVAYPWMALYNRIMYVVTFIPNKIVRFAGSVFGDIKPRIAFELLSREPVEVELPRKTKGKKEYFQKSQ